MKEYVKILVADDETVMRNMLLRILETEGYKVTTVASAAEAVEQLKIDKYDILLSDVAMPGPTGFELLRRAKKDYPDMAVIIMTGYGEAYTVKEALLNGADEYLTKPFKSQEISLIIERAYWRLLSSRNAEKHKEQVLIDDQAVDI